MSEAASVTLQCVSCKHRWVVSPIPREPPMCPKCSSVALVIRVGDVDRETKSITMGPSGQPSDRNPRCLHCVLADAVDRFRQEVMEVDASTVTRHLCDLLAETIASAAANAPDPAIDRRARLERYINRVPKEVRTRARRAFTIFLSPTARN